MDEAGVTAADGDHSTAHATSMGQDAYPNYAFLVHSQTSLVQDLPPKVDTAMTARPKRRRTSAEDHTILEAAYQENSKPDKSERTAIVKRIWFQNRRQNDRRKSRPLLPHEMVPHFRNPVPQVLLDSPRAADIGPTESHRAPGSADEVPGATGGEDLERSSSRASSIHELLNPALSVDTHTSPSSDPLTAEGDGSPARQPWTSVSQGASSGASSDARVPTEGNNDVTVSLEHAIPSLRGVKRYRDDRAETERDQMAATLVHVPCIASHGPQVRLAMSLDGAVKVKTNNEATPSPPKQRAPAPTFARTSAAGLHRSKSAIAFGVPTREESGGRSKGKATGGQFGRSRDARTWEFYCDGDVREALSAHAENERIGSAVGAINLIRSQSQKSRQQVLTEQASAGTARSPALSGRASKAKLSRAKSSMGRLQDTDQSFVKPATGEGKPCQERSPGDSDKENWPPGTRPSRHLSRQQHASRNGKPIPGDEDYRPNQTRSVGGLATGAKRSDVMGGHIAVDQGDVIRSGHRQTVMQEGGKGEDLDCIQGLLSLSQGAWR